MQVGSLKYELENLKQERQLEDLRHEKELREFKLKADADFRKFQVRFFFFFFFFPPTCHGHIHVREY